MEEKNKNKKLTDEMLHEAALRMFELEEKQLEEEMKNAEPHVFSAEFEQKMAAILNGEDPRLKAAKRKKKMYRMLRYTAAIVVTAVLMATVVYNKNENVVASNMKVRIVEWLENAFIREEGEPARQESVRFEKEQIGYLPEGFKLVFEEVTFTRVYYKFLDTKENYIMLKAGKSKATLGVDNGQVAQDVYINSAGLEYQFIIYEDSNVNGVLWTGKDRLVYALYGTVSAEELVNVMDGIIYKGE